MVKRDVFDFLDEELSMISVEQESDDDDEDQTSDEGKIETIFVHRTAKKDLLIFFSRGRRSKSTRRNISSIRFHSKIFFSCRKKVKLA